MRILQIIPSVSLVYGGPSQMVLGLSATLVRQGVQVTIITTDANGDIGQPPLAVPLNQPLEQAGYQIIYFRCSPFHRYKFSISLFQWLNLHAKEFDLAHIHALFSPISTLSATLARYHRLPYILRPCGMLDPADLRKKKKLKEIYASLLEKPNLAGAAAIHFTSHQEAKISERFGLQTQKKDLVIPLGISAELLEADFHSGATSTVFPQFPDIPWQKNTILFMSRIEPKKGLDLLIPALEILLKEGIDFHFILAGSNSQDARYEVQIQSQIRSSPLGERTTIAGFVTGDLKVALLQTVDLFVLPSYYENFGIAVAEAMACGTPVVISDQVHIWEDVRQAEAGWVGPCAIDAIASLIRTALQNPEERKRRGQQAKQYAKTHYSWDAIAHQTVLAYQRILSHSN